MIKKCIIFLFSLFLPLLFLPVQNTYAVTTEHSFFQYGYIPYDNNFNSLSNSCQPTWSSTVCRFSGYFYYLDSMYNGSLSGIEAGDEFVATFPFLYENSLFINSVFSNDVRLQIDDYQFVYRDLVDSDTRTGPYAVYTTRDAQGNLVETTTSSAPVAYYPEFSDFQTTTIVVRGHFTQSFNLGYREALKFGFAALPDSGSTTRWVLAGGSIRIGKTFNTTNLRLDDIIELIESGATTQPIVNAVNDTTESVDNLNNTIVQQRQADNNAMNNSQSSADSSADSSGAQAEAQGTTLLQILQGFASAIATPSSGSCVINMDLTGYGASNYPMDLCQLSPPPAVTGLLSVVVVGFVIKAVLSTIEAMLALYKEYQS